MPLKLPNNHHIAQTLELILILCVAISGCVNKYNNLVWKEMVPSPDGAYIATASTSQSGGFGSAFIATEVELEQAHIPETQTTVITFDCEGPVPRPYTLDNVANKGGTINLSLEWISPTELLVTYSGNPIINFQAIKYQAITIKLERLQTSLDISSQNGQPSVRKPVR